MLRRHPLVCSLSVMLGTLCRGLPCSSELVTSISDCCDNMITHACMLSSISVYSISIHAISTLMLRSIMIEPSSPFLQLTLHFWSDPFRCIGMCRLSPISVLCLSHVTMFWFQLSQCQGGMSEPRVWCVSKWQRSLRRCDNNNKNILLPVMSKQQHSHRFFTSPYVYIRKTRSSIQNSKKNSVHLTKSVLFYPWSVISLNDYKIKVSKVKNVNNYRSEIMWSGFCGNLSESLFCLVFLSEM